MADDILRVQKVATKEIIERSIMISKKFKVLEVIGNKEYIFSTYAFKNAIKKYAIRKTTTESKYTASKVKSDLAQKLCVSEDAIKNWICGYNGPSDIEVVKNMATFFEINYMDLLGEKEKDNMNNTTISNENTSVISYETKAVIRTVYQKMAAFMDDIAENLPYDFGGEENFHRYESRIDELIFLLHQSMLDIPADIYDKLLSIVTNTFDYYLHGDEEHGFTIWEEGNYCSLCDSLSQEMYSERAMCIYMEKESAKFYENIREILKNYIVA